MTQNKCRRQIDGRKKEKGKGERGTRHAAAPRRHERPLLREFKMQQQEQLGRRIERGMNE